ncbi:hypothetical protein [Photobacterium leiognathi]|uniref:hypothetical protein n=1 Tax=Photobacterium leiognathi TaxID=553611 RepID=UPI0006B69210|nr:hypothetical protein [Photobacterium leiognathi]KPA54556.1 hypothetical protein VT25_01305 [Photobacterium leiognathi subsp. mandapamensis]
MKKIILGAALSLTTFSSLAAYIPSPTMAQGDRVRVRGESGIEIDATYAPDMTIQFGGGIGQDRRDERYRDHYDRHNKHDRNEGTIYIQAIVPVTFGKKKQPDPNRLYDIELRAREAHISKLEAEVRLLKAAANSGAIQSKDLYVE